MASYIDPQRLEPFLVHILTPVHRITEDDTIRDPQMGGFHLSALLTHLTGYVISDELKILAIEVQDLIQSKVGTTKFSAAYSHIRQTVIGIQRERKAARVTQVIFTFFF